MRRRIRQTVVAAFLLLPPLFAWGCGPAPTWRRFLDSAYQPSGAPTSREFHAVGPIDDSGRQYLVLDAATGRTLRQFRLPPHFDPWDRLPDGSVLAISRTSGWDDPLLFGVDPSRPPRAFPKPSFAAGSAGANADPTGRWIITTVTRRPDADHGPLAAVVFDLKSESPPRVLENLAWAFPLHDGRRAIFFESSPKNPTRQLKHEPMKAACVDLATGERVWEVDLRDDYHPPRFAPARHWVAFPRRDDSPNDGCPRWVVFDDRTGKKVLEGDNPHIGLSWNGVVVEPDAVNWSYTLQGLGFTRRLDLGSASSSRRFWFECMGGDRERIATIDSNVLLNAASLGVRRFTTWDSVVRLRRRVWDVQTGEELESEVQYQLADDLPSWNGAVSADGDFEIREHELFGFHWLERIERPARRNVVLRILIGAAPALGVLAFQRRRGRHEVRASGEGTPQ